MTLPTHPLYQALLTSWREYRLCYRGGRAYTDAYLAKHAKEPDSLFAARRERAVHPNHARSILDTYAAHLYRQPIPRTSTLTLHDAFWANMDLLGTPATEFYERAAQLVQRDGRCAVVVDRLEPNRDELPLTRAQERELGRRPYAYVIEAHDLLDWSVDRQGRLLWAIVREHVPDERAPMEGISDSPRERLRIWTRTSWQLIERTQRTNEHGVVVESSDLIDQGEHPVGEVPIALVFWGARHGVEPIGDSALTDIAPMNRRLTNLISLIDEQIYQHVFSLLAVPESTYAALEKINFAPSGALSYRDDVSSTPYYLSPDVAQIGAIRAEIEKTEAEIRALSGLGRVNEDGPSSARSGLALSYMTMDKDALLAKFGQRMARLEAAVDRLAMAWMEERGEASREYPTSFDPQDLEAELNNAMKFASLQIPGLAGREAQAAAVRSFLGSRLSPERLEEVIRDLLAQPERSGLLGF